MLQAPVPSSFRQPWTGGPVLHRTPDKCLLLAFGAPFPSASAVIRDWGCLHGAPPWLPIPSGAGLQDTFPSPPDPRLDDTGKGCTGESSGPLLHCASSVVSLWNSQYPVGNRGLNTATQGGKASSQLPLGENKGS